MYSDRSAARAGLCLIGVFLMRIPSASEYISRIDIAYDYHLIIVSRHTIAHLIRAPKAGEDGVYKYSTPNKDWPVLTTYRKGQRILIEPIMTAHHWVSSATNASCGALRYFQGGTAPIVHIG